MKSTTQFVGRAIQALRDLRNHSTTRPPTSAQEKPAYPSDTRVEVGAALPDLEWSGIDAHGDARVIALHEWYAPNEASRLLVVRIDGGAWCGTCRWHAVHDGELANEPFAARIAHLDLTIVCEAPRIGVHRDAMRANIARLAGIGAERVGVKATTSEKLGFTGREEGIAVHAVALLLPA